MANYEYGRNSVRASIEAGIVKELFLLNGFDFLPILDLLKNSKIKATYMDRRSLSNLVKTENHQGIVALTSTYNYDSLDNIIAKAKNKKDPLILLLDEIQDPHNFGAIIRSADAFGVDGIIIKKDRQVEVTATVIKVATGAQNYVPIAQVSNLNNAISKLKDNGFWVVSTDGNAKSTISSLEYNFPVALIIGSEGAGISRLVIANSDFLVKIPMEGHVNSLNASVATGIILSAIRIKQEH